MTDLTEVVTEKDYDGVLLRRTGNIAVIVPDITNPHFGSLVRSVERSARQSDLQVLLIDTGEHPDEEVRAAVKLLGGTWVR